jgi:hypothetical protein
VKLRGQGFQELGRHSAPPQGLYSRKANPLGLYTVHRTWANVLEFFDMLINRGGIRVLFVFFRGARFYKLSTIEIEMAYFVRNSLF